MHEAKTYTLDEMLPGARVAVGQCLDVTPNDRVYIITDRDTLLIGEALAEAARERGAAAVRTVLLEDFGQRPFTDIPQGFIEAIVDFAPTVTFYAAQAQPGEIAFRIQMGTELRQRLNVRHGHMIGITPPLMMSGMLANYEEVAALTMRVYERVKNAREIRVTNAEGTDFTAHLDPNRLRWIPCTGLYHAPGNWGNLPEGELFTSPANANGVLTANLLGDHFSEKYGLLDEPVRFIVQDGEVVRIEHPNAALAEEVWSYLNSAENGRRVGEFAIGTNTALTELTGNLLQDEKYPGVHVAFGNPYPDLTGAEWTSRVHVDVIPLRVDIFVDGTPIMKEGKFLLEEL
nr:aminopeptidase [Ardenticatena sp.]